MYIHEYTHACHGSYTPVGVWVFLLPSLAPPLPPSIPPSLAPGVYNRADEGLGRQDRGCLEVVRVVVDTDGVQGGRGGGQEGGRREATEKNDASVHAPAAAAVGTVGLQPLGQDVKGEGGGIPVEVHKNQKETRR